MKKNIMAILLLLSALIFSLAGCDSSKTVFSDTGVSLPDVINIGTQQMPNDENLARAKGFFEELGVKVNIIEFDSGRDVNAALASNSIDLGLLGSTPATIGIATGIPVELIWIHDILGKSESLAVKNSANVNSIEDLVGKKVAVPFGSTAHYSLLNAFKINNVDIKTVVVLDMQPADIYAAWQRGDIDAAYVWQPTLGKLLEDGKIIISSEDLAEKGIITADIEVVRTEFGQKYPELVTSYIKLQSKAYDIYKNDFDDAVKSIAQALQIDEAESRKEITETIWLSAQEQIGSKYLGTSNAKGDIVKTLKDTADFLAEQKAIEFSPELSVFEKAVNPKFIEESLK